jgi:ADP-ribose pyrophosphatase YjhB (NUDIX family)
MSIRSTVKAIIVKDGKILLNKCYGEVFGDYFSLPGGGQHQHETLEEAVVRECLEETGYAVAPIRLAAVCETILSEKSRKNNPEHTHHRVYHIFICEIFDDEKITPTGKDGTQLEVGSEWVDINTINAINVTRLFPIAVRDNIQGIINGTAPAYLGSNYLE